jgi:hypothetical protein
MEKEINSNILNCFFEGPPSVLFDKLPKEIINLILNFVKPEYVFIAKYANIEIVSLDQYEEIFMAMCVADVVCDMCIEENDLDSIGFVHKILKNHYWIVTDHFKYFEFVGGKKIKRKNVEQAFYVLNIDSKQSRFKIPKLQDLFLLFNYDYIRYTIRR